MNTGFTIHVIGPLHIECSPGTIKWFFPTMLQLVAAKLWLPLEACTSIDSHWMPVTGCPWWLADAISTMMSSFPWNQAISFPSSVLPWLFCKTSMFFPVIFLISASMFCCWFPFIRTSPLNQFISSVLINVVVFPFLIRQDPHNSRDTLWMFEASCVLAQLFCNTKSEPSTQQNLSKYWFIDITCDSWKEPWGMSPENSWKCSLSHQRLTILPCSISPSFKQALGFFHRTITQEPPWKMHCLNFVVQTPCSYWFQLCTTRVQSFTLEGKVLWIPVVFRAFNYCLLCLHSKL